MEGRKSFVVCALVIIALFFTGSKVEADSTATKPDGSVSSYVAPRECTFALGKATVRVWAGPLAPLNPADNALNPTFPIPVVDPADLAPIKGNFLLWQYRLRVVSGSTNLSQAFVTAASDGNYFVPNATQITLPAAGDSSLNNFGTGVGDFWVFRYNPDQNTVIANLYTRGGVPTGGITVGAKSGSLVNQCATQGPAGPAPESPFQQQLAFTQEIFGPCVVNKAQSGGNIIAFETFPSDPSSGAVCVVTVNGDPIQNVTVNNIAGDALFTGDTQFSVTGSCQYCTTNRGKLYCGTCSNCVVINGQCTPQ